MSVTQLTVTLDPVMSQTSTDEINGAGSGAGTRGGAAIGADCSQTHARCNIGIAAKMRTTAAKILSRTQHTSTIAFIHPNQCRAKYIPFLQCVSFMLILYKHAVKTSIQRFRYLITKANTLTVMVSQNPSFIPTAMVTLVVIHVPRI